MADQIDEDIKSERLRACNTRSTATRRRSIANVCRSFDVLFERPGRHPGQLVGRSPYLQPVHIEAPVSLIGTIAPVTITEIASQQSVRRAAPQAHRSPPNAARPALLRAGA